MRTTKKLKVDEKRLLAYAVAAGAVLAAAGPADASVKYGAVGTQMPRNGSITVDITGTAYKFGFDNLSASTSGPGQTFNSVGGAGMLPGVTVNFGFMATVSSNAAKLALQSPVGPSGNFNKYSAILFQTWQVNSKSYQQGNFLQGADGYLGFRIPDANHTANYGWIHLDNFTVAPNASSYRVVDWAYQNDGSAILAGEGATAVPEPTSSALALIAMGAAGVAIYRKRKQDAQG